MKIFQFLTSVCQTVFDIVFSNNNLIIFPRYLSFSTSMPFVSNLVTQLFKYVLSAFGHAWRASKKTWNVSIHSPSIGITIEFTKLLYNSIERKGNFYLLYIRFRNSQRRFKFELLERKFPTGMEISGQDNWKTLWKFWWNGKFLLWDIT